MTRSHSVASRRWIGPPPATPRRVQDYIDTAVIADDPVDGVADRSFVGHVDDAHVAVATGLQIDADDLRAFVREPAGARESDPRRGARHQRDPVVEATHDGMLTETCSSRQGGGSRPWP